MRQLLAGILVGLSAAVVVLGADALFTSFGGGGLQPLLAIELKTYDWRLSHTARPETARTDIALIDIDERSLRLLQPFAGRWPWPRVVHSSLIDFLAQSGARLIVYDIDFADADTRIGFKYGDSTWSGAESDKALADSIRAAGNVILLADASYDADTPEIDAPAARRLRRSTCPAFSIARACCRRSASLASAASGSATTC